MSKKNSSPKLPRNHSACHQCQKRQVGCHSSCAAYLAFHEKNLAMADARHKEHKALDDVAAVFANRQKENQRKIRGKRR